MIIALQCCHHDVYIALELTRLICDIEEKKRGDVTFAISPTRFVNKHAVEEIAAIARTRFSHVFTVKNTRFGTGWPNGCNDLWFETMMRLRMDRKKLIGGWVLTIEPDCIPMRPDWINRMIGLIGNRRNGALAIGHIHGEPKTHLNGNALFDLDIVHRLKLTEGDGIGGWDVMNRKEIMPYCEDTDEFYQIYRIRHIKPERVARLAKNGHRPSIFHGIKGTLGIEAVRWMMANNQFHET